MNIPFMKMQGLGNDFIFLDQRSSVFDLTEDHVRRLCNRRLGIGCDQLIILQPPQSPSADVYMSIYNTDGSKAGACGNATRCLGFFLCQELSKHKCTIETVSGLLHTHLLSHDRVQVDMGKPDFQWSTIPLSNEMDVLNLPISCGVLSSPVALSMGNPHMVFFVKDVMGLDIHSLGAELTHHPFYPEGANVQFVEIIDRKTIRVRVYERGAGVTLSSGTGASASVVAGIKRKLIDKAVSVRLDGGNLDISYEDTVLMSGPVGFSYRGHFDERIFAGMTAPRMSKAKTHGEKISDKNTSGSTMDALKNDPDTFNHDRSQNGLYQF